MDRGSPNVGRRRGSAGPGRETSRERGGDRPLRRPIMDDRGDFGMAAKETERLRLNSERPEPGQIDLDKPPVGFRTLSISNWNNQVSDAEIEENLYQTCKKFGDFNIKIVNNGDFRVAYINFRFPENAVQAQHFLADIVMFDRKLHADPVYTQKRGRSQSPEYNRKYFRGRYGGRANSPAPRSRSRTAPVHAPSSVHSNEEYLKSGGFSERLSGGGGGEGYQSEPKFPYHLDHRPPEEDVHATRTLFIGNLDLETEPDDIRTIFNRFGIIEDVDVKRPAKGQGNAFAFVRFLNLDMAHVAKVAMSGRLIGRYQCKIGYGKAQATNCVWIGGLGPWVRGETLEREFDRFGVIHRIEWPPGKDFAYVLYNNVDAATAACQAMRGFLIGPDRRIRVDFSDPSHLQMAFDEMNIPRISALDAIEMYNSPLPDYEREAPRETNRGYEESWRNNDQTYNDVSRPSGRGNREEWGSRDRNFRGSTRNNNWDRNQRNNYNNENRKGFREDRNNTNGKAYNKHNNNGQTPFERGSGGSAGDDFREAPPERNNSRHFNNTNNNRAFSPISQRRRMSEEYPKRNDFGRAEHPESNGADVMNDGYVQSASHVENFAELTTALPCVWSGALVLKNSAFAAKMHLMKGNVSIVDTLMRDPTSTEMPLLKVMQRLRLDQPKLDEVARRMTSNNHAVLLALPGSTQTVEESNTNIQQRPLRNLVSYLKQKEAAGVIALPPCAGKQKAYEDAGVLHAFPPCQFGHDFISKCSPKLGVEPVKDDHLVIIVVRNDA